MKKRISVLIAVFAAALALFAAVPASSNLVYASETEPSGVEVLFFAPDENEAAAPDDADDNNFISLYGADNNNMIPVSSDADINETVSSGTDDGESNDDRSQNISDSIKIMGQGMLGIFVVMLLIYLVVVVLNAATKDHSGDEEDND